MTEKTGYINRTVEYRGYNINCRDPFGFWDIDGEEHNYTTVGKARAHIDNMILLKDAAKAKKEQAAKITK